MGNFSRFHKKRNWNMWLRIATWRALQHQRIPCVVIEPLDTKHLDRFAQSAAGKPATHPEVVAQKLLRIFKAEVFPNCAMCVRAGSFRKRDIISLVALYLATLIQIEIALNGVPKPIKRSEIRSFKWESERHETWSEATRRINCQSYAKWHKRK